jgi:hypothetical protein
LEHSVAAYDVQMHSGTGHEVYRDLRGWRHRSDRPSCKREGGPWRCSVAGEPTFASLMRTAGDETQPIYADWQQMKLQCCQMNLG